MYAKLLILTLVIDIGQVASASPITVVCSQADVNLAMRVEGTWIFEAELYDAVSGDDLGSVNRNDITLSPGEAFIRTDVQYSATGSFTNCH